MTSGHLREPPEIKRRERLVVLRIQLWLVTMERDFIEGTLRLEQLTVISLSSHDLPAEAIENGMEDIQTILRPYNKAQIAIFGFTVFLFASHMTIIIWPLWALQNGVTSSPVFGPIFLFKGIFARECLQRMFLIIKNYLLWT